MSEISQQIREKAQGTMDAPFWMTVASIVEDLDAELDHLRGVISEGTKCRDTERLDWLEGEYERELTCPRTALFPPSIFRRNVPITRALIDEAMQAGKESK